MKISVEDLAKQQIIDIYYYNLRYSLKNAISVNRSIRMLIHDIERFPYIGRYIPELHHKNFREVIYRKTRYSGYRIIYYTSEKTNIIYIISVVSSKQDFRKILINHNYFNKYFNL